ncbi:60S ribosomal protein L28-1-like isoform X1 [Hibiscus syriacus]|nr:60S ribosomal protein L28-1-like isoform X1 [Hibiscus syriacus]
MTHHSLQISTQSLTRASSCRASVSPLIKASTTHSASASIINLSAPKDFARNKPCLIPQISAIEQLVFPIFTRCREEIKMATVPGQLIWEVVKKNNCFLVKQFGRGTAGVRFSKEPNNLYNLNSYKHSGLANKKTVTIQPGGKDQSVLLATTKTKKQNKPSSLLHKSVMKKEFPTMVKAVKNQVTDNYYRPDLTKAALARLSAVHRSLKVAKSGVKKRNRQALKISGRK